MSNTEKNDCLILNKCINGIVQAAKQNYKKAIKTLKNLGFVECNVDPCLYTKKGANGVVYIALYTDNNSIIGDITAIDDAITAL